MSWDAWTGYAPGLHKSISVVVAAIESIAPKIGCVSQTLHDWVRKHEIDTGVRDGVTSDERERLKTLERENKDPPTRPMEDAGSGRTGYA